MPDRAQKAALAVAVTFALAAGCVPKLEGGEPREPKREVPAAFGSAAGSAEAPGAAVAKQTFRIFFASPELRALIETALAENQELNIRLQEIIIAQNEVSARSGESQPKVGAQAGAGVERSGKHTSQGVSDEAHGLPANLGNFQFGLAASWEVDVWGKLRDATKAADLRYRASIEARNFLVTQIVAELARSYFELLAIDNELEVLTKNLGILERAFEVVKVQKEAARVTELAVRRFEAEVNKNKSRLFGLQQERTQVENRINFLVGRYPRPIERDAKKLREPLPPMIHAGVPADLLENRPDIRQAELELEAAKLDVKVAKAAFYPSLSVDAGVGFRSFNASHLVSPDSLVSNLAGNLTAPLLNRKALEAQYKSANARQIQAVFNYERSLLSAVIDVANQLSRIENLQKSFDLQAKQVESLEKSNEAANILFQSARADYLEVLMTQRDALDAELELIETRKAQYLGMVSLYQALGGGWRAK